MYRSYLVLVNYKPFFLPILLLLYPKKLAHKEDKIPSHRHVLPRRQNDYECQEQ